MPRSRSRSLESMTRSATCWLARKAPLCFSSWSTRVVLPWSTWAMMAMLRNFMIVSFQTLRIGGAPLTLKRRAVRMWRKSLAGSAECRRRSRGIAAECVHDGYSLREATSSASGVSGPGAEMGNHFARGQRRRCGRRPRNRGHEYSHKGSRRRKDRRRRSGRRRGRPAKPGSRSSRRRSRSPSLVRCGSGRPSRNAAGMRAASSQSSVSHSARISLILANRMSTWFFDQILELPR